MTLPTPAAAPALTWPEPPDKCPACGAPIVERIQFLIVYECEQAILTQHRDGKSIEHPDSHCTRAFPAAVAQRQRAEDAEQMLRWTYQELGSETELDQSAPLNHLVRRKLAGAEATAQAIQQRADALAAQVAALRAALEGAREYMRHAEGCSYPFNKLYGCRCGMLETLAETDAALAAAPEGVTK